MDSPKLPIYLAPLQGYTEAAYRNAHTISFGGIAEYYTPFVRYEKEGFRNKDVREILPINNRVPQLRVQLFANDATKAEAILKLFIEHDHHKVDINMGCPFPMLAKRHNGSGILPYPDEVKALLEVVSKYPEIDFSVKMRLGWENPNEWKALMPILNDTPLTQITLHPRIGKQQYKGEVNLEEFEEFANACRHPLIYNGDVNTLEDMARIADRFKGISGLMIGRGLLANPALALEYQEDRKLSEEEFRRRLLQLHQEVLNQYTQQIEGGEAQLLNKMKTFWEYAGMAINSKVAKRIQKSRHMDSYLQEIRNI